MNFNYTLRQPFHQSFVKDQALYLVYGKDYGDQKDDLKGKVESSIYVPREV